MIRLDPAAKLDLERVLVHYESERPGLGVRFGITFDTVIAWIDASPLLFPVVHRDVRRALMPSPFRSYGVFYRLLPGLVLVVGVMYLRRSPSRIRRR